MKKFTFILLLCAFAQSVFAIEFDHYHSFVEINQYLQEEARLNPDLVTYKKLGLSAQAREVGLVVITKPTSFKKEAIYFNGTHHGDEKSSTESVLGMIDYFIKNADQAEVSEFLSKYALYFQPLVNPDGHFNNKRTLANGVDPNRDYSWPGTRDEDAFKQVEIQLIKRLADEVKFKGAIAYHSGIVEILWPWCYTDEASREENTLMAITKEMARTTNVSRYMASYNDYPTQGEFIDYVHWKHGTVALTVELSTIKTPPIKDIPAIIDTSIKGALTFIRSLDQMDAGTLPRPKNMYEGMTGQGRSALVAE